MRRFFITLLFAFETHGKGAADRVRQALAGVLRRVEPVTHPPACRAVATYVGEAAFVVAVGRAERDFLNRLVHDQSLCAQWLCEAKRE